jgi:hypothetical protein
MNMSAISPGDVVAVDVRGHRYYGIASHRDRGELKIVPITNGGTWRSVTARQITGHWRKTSRTPLPAVLAAEVTP